MGIIKKLVTIPSDTDITLELNGNVLPVQISANIVLVLSKTFVIFSEAETCSNLEKKKDL